MLKRVQHNGGTKGSHSELVSESITVKDIIDFRLLLLFSWNLFRLVDDRLQNLLKERKFLCTCCWVNLRNCWKTA